MVFFKTLINSKKNKPVNNKLTVIRGINMTKLAMLVAR